MSGNVQQSIGSDVEFGVGRSATANGSITIQSSIEYDGQTYPVTFTSPYAGYNNNLITGITLPPTIKRIGRNGFKDCPILRTIIFRGIYNVNTNPIAIEPNAFTGLPTKLNSSNPLTIYTYPLSDVNPVYSYFKAIYGDTINYSDYTCFKEDTKILTDKGYIPIQDLRKGDLVKTLNDGYKAISMIGKQEMYHNISQENKRNQLYNYSPDAYPEIFEDLVITGGHSILLDSLNEEEMKKQEEWISESDLLIDNKYRMLAFLDEKSISYEPEGLYTIYHLALEGDYNKNYGIYANGLLVEACSQQYLKEESNMILIE
jgi:hypothetical protein